MKGAAMLRAFSASTGGNVLSLLGMLLTVIAVLALAYWCTRWIGQRGMPGWARGAAGGEKLQLLWQVSLGKGERLVLVRVHERCLLLGVTGGGISVLTELTEQEAAGWLQNGRSPPGVQLFGDFAGESAETEMSVIDCLIL